MYFNYLKTAVLIWWILLCGKSEVAIETVYRRGTASLPASSQGKGAAKGLFGHLAQAWVPSGSLAHVVLLCVCCVMI